MKPEESLSSWPLLRWARAILCLGALAGGVVLLGGCVTKATAEAQARAAFIAGEQHAMKMQQAQGPSVTVVGAVHNTSVPWTEHLTLAQAVVAADYYGPEPQEIDLVRAGKATEIDPKTLLNGQDVPLQAQDIIQIK